MNWNINWINTCFLLLSICRIFSQEAYVQSSVFYATGKTPYVDLRIYISHKQWSKVYTADSLLTMSVDLTLVLKKADTIVKASRIQLQTPPDKTALPFFHAENWEMVPGTYILEANIKDVQNPSIELGLIDSIRVRQKTGKQTLSDIQFLQYARASADSTHQLYKNGIYGEPLPYQTYYPHQNILFAYLESYVAEEQQSSYYLKYTILRKDSLNRNIPIREWFKKRKPTSVEPHLIQQDISELTSGSYALKVELLDPEKKVLEGRLNHFYRENPFWDRIHYLFTSRKDDKLFFDTLPLTLIDYGMRAVHPLITGVDVSTLNQLLKDKKEQEKRMFLFTYFSERADTARIAFMNYLKLARYLDDEFKSGFGYGFETDRGIMYLRYGKPDEIIKEDKDNGAFPYEIWKYHKVAKGGQTNVKFLFYNPDLAGSDFRLLHSTAIGERFNRKWEIELYKNAPNEVKGDNFFDASEMQPNINRRAREYFDN